MIGTDTNSCSILQVGETYRDLGVMTENADMQPAECRNGENPTDTTRYSQDHPPLEDLCAQIIVIYVLPDTSLLQTGQFACMTLVQIHVPLLSIF